MLLCSSRLNVMRFAIVIGAVLSSQPALAVPDERQIRRDCRMDALTYCKKAILTADRSTIINCMLQHKDKLQPKCSRHLY